jgi:hypothetical protein
MNIEEHSKAKHWRMNRTIMTTHKRVSDEWVSVKLIVLNVSKWAGAICIMFVDEKGVRIFLFGKFEYT